MNEHLRPRRAALVRTGAVVMLLLLSVALLAVRTGRAATPAATPAATLTPAPTKVATPAATDTVEITATAAVTDSAAETAPVGPPQDALPVVAAQTSMTLADTQDYDGKPVGFTDAGFPFMGDPAAPVTMVEYSDYLCPFCGRHVAETLPTLIDEYILTGKLRLVFRDFPIASLHPNAPQGHQAAWCVGQDDPVAYWAMHDQLFSRQSEWNQVADPSDFLADAAAQSGADAAVYQACMDAGETIARVNNGIAEGQTLGFSGTPSFVFFSNALPDTYTVVGAYPLDYFRQYIDALLAGEQPPADPQAQTQTPQLPPWALTENLVADPANPGFNLYGDHTMGSDEAPVTIIEFSDMQCPACALHATEVQPMIVKEYIETGKVRWVFKHRPLMQIHPLAGLGAAAVECASDQGQFWEMQDALYQNIQAWAPEDEDWTTAEAEAGVTALAEDLGMDTAIFAACIDSRAPMERVILDLDDAFGIVDSTPTFIALFNGQGTLIGGSRPVDDFRQLLDALLAEADKSTTSN